MKKAFLILAVMVMTAFSSFAQIENPVAWEKSLKDLGQNQYEISLVANVDSGYYIYAMDNYENGPTGTSFKFTIEGDAELVGEVTPSQKAKVAFDDIFKMDIGKLNGTITFTQKVKLNSTNPAEITILAEWMSCTDEACTPPTDEEFTFSFNGGIQKAATTAVTPSSPTGEVRSGNENARSLWSIAIEAILWGFAALLTPCVFPMIPMTVSFFMKGSENKAKGRAMASFYGFSIVALYTIPIAAIIFITYFIGGDAITADIFNWLATHWIPNVLFFLVFMLFAASFLGAFEIVMPSWLVNKSDEKADKGGFLGVFFMALTLVLVSFSSYI